MKIIGFILLHDALSLACIVGLPSLDLKVVLVVYKKGTCGGSSNYKSKHRSLAVSITYTQSQ